MRGLGVSLRRFAVKAASLAFAAAVVFVGWSRHPESCKMTSTIEMVMSVPKIPNSQDGPGRER